MSGLYIHIPFCASKCSYCDFYSMPLKDGSVARQYLDAAIKEFRLRRDELTEPVKTIYIGGGTPSQLPAPALAGFIENLAEDPLVDIDKLDEFTIEANPEDITSEWVETIAKSGIDRVSIGIQSFNDNELKTVNRRHNAQKAVDAISLIRSAGISEISGDLIYGLPGQTIATWNDSLDRMLELKLPHISAYSLSYEPGTRLSAMLQAGKIEPTAEDLFIEMYETLIQRLGEAGYEHYEISNFALPGHRAKHNCGYWEFTPYLGIGPGAHSFDGKNRRNNPPSLKKYIETLSEMKTACVVESEDTSDLINDYIITALRKSEGIDFIKMEKALGNGPVEAIKKQARKFVASGQLIADSGTLRFTEKSWLVSDMILCDLLQ